MLDLVKLAEIAEWAHRKFQIGPDGYLCGPNTFRALLTTVGLIPRDQKRFVASAGEVSVTVTVSHFVPDDGKFYPRVDPGPVTFTALSRTAR